ncbi:hypothetical protein LZ31DRAFT_484756 [Colletotrichum somersetense]|nr:hypothetical protein LZ31DRAFT_484756 [Colletotrichum somersetense]
MLSSFLAIYFYILVSLKIYILNVLLTTLLGSVIVLLFIISLFKIGIIKKGDKIFILVDKLISTKVTIEW